MGQEQVVSVVAESQPTPVQKIILLVEDNPILSRIMQRIIETCTPHRVIQLSDGETILEKISEHNPDLLIFDYDLPEKNGIELYDFVRASEGCEHIPVILISAELPEEQIARRNLPSLSKPYKTGVLLEMLEEVLV
jgi:CheY-like chemotaxis protein